MWSKKYSEAERETLRVLLLSKFELAFENEDKSIIVPWLVREKQEEPLALGKALQCSYYVGLFLPMGFANRLFVRLSNNAQIFATGKTSFRQIDYASCVFLLHNVQVLLKIDGGNVIFTVEQKSQSNILAKVICAVFQEIFELAPEFKPRRTDALIWRCVPLEGS